jgi:hypothetical protein
MLRQILHYPYSISASEPRTPWPPATPRNAYSEAAPKPEIPQQ